MAISQNTKKTLAAISRYGIFIALVVELIAFVLSEPAFSQWNNHIVV